MAWKSVSSMEERVRFVLEAQIGFCNMTELCERYGISRKTGYKWLKRFEAEGVQGMHERSRSPKHCPHRTPDEVVKRIVAERRKHSKWGPKKIAEVLMRSTVEFKVPAPSTIGSILDREGLVRRRKRRRAAVTRWPAKLTQPQWANHVWGVDFKGWFRTGDGNRCDPLTASDLYSRFVLECRGVRGQTTDIVRPVFKKVFTDYGLPEIIRVDNGAPFGARGVLGLSKLSMWWVQLGIRVQFIDPGHPEQNSVHERMHRTLKDETTCPPQSNLKAQQQRFDQWRQEFNFERPHEALGMRRPSDVYKASTSAYPRRPRPFTYPVWFEVRRVRKAGQIVVNGRPRFIGRAFAGVAVGLEPITCARWLVHAGPLTLGILEQNSKNTLLPLVTQSAHEH